ncbi:hypothetical protein BDK51DRAFT_34582 [Blyttiomyces helicus]|uniref:Adenosine deaminase domain-containing protein n=1 Tax=Blyttiomyces helicus TaxID=388810 RepID=A0A4P9WBY2_9FUNG|nr:hypothetical protein BDK51DRAFT_34582 [Blyttiomyces helicus]|eukprot:RKO87826.1 hypothetical protein BDK51DRAFT_34582 [Blyttiomyces helicus]
MLPWTPLLLPLLLSLAFPSPATQSPLPTLPAYPTRLADLKRADAGPRFDRATRALLSPAEIQFSAALGHRRDTEARALRLIESFPPAMPFAAGRDIMRRSEVYALLESMPKGAVLHSHSAAAVGLGWMVQEAVRLGDSWIRLAGWGLGKVASRKLAGRVPGMHEVAPGTWMPEFRFSRSRPDGDPHWDPLDAVRSAYPGGAAAFDKAVEFNVSILSSHPEIDYPTDKTAWVKFARCFPVIGSLIGYLPLLRSQFRHIFEISLADSTTLIELRWVPNTTYDITGRVYTVAETVDALHDVAEAFKAERPEFGGFGLIPSLFRAADVKVVEAQLRQMVELRVGREDWIVGVDLVGEEILAPLSVLVPSVLSTQQYAHTLNTTLPLFLHAGETLLAGPAPDENLYDALLLGARRIGHGISLARHPALIDLIIKEEIAVEVCLISNSMLR